MNRKHRPLIRAMAFVVFLAGSVGVETASAQGRPRNQQQREILAHIPIKGDTTHTLSKHFSPATTVKKAPNAKGFVQRWLVLEPIKKDIRSNNIFTGKYLRTTFSADNFSKDFTAIPQKGQEVKVGNQELKWYALDSKDYDFNLNHFTYAINKPRFGVLFWLVTVIDCPEEIKNVRLAAGCNSAGMWWVNGTEALMLSGNRDMVVDNGTSPRLTLHKGKNIIRGAVINGPGMCDFCLRFIDEKGLPVKNFSISYQ